MGNPGSTDMPLQIEKRSNRLHQLHLPDEVRVFNSTRVEADPSSQALVLDSVYGDDNGVAYGRCYCFLNRWLSVFVTFDKELQLHQNCYGDFTFAFNCDVTTPHLLDGSAVFTTDLFIDVLVAVDGETYLVKDIDEHDDGFSQGLFGPSWQIGAKNELRRLVDELKRGEFLGILQSIAPFPTSFEGIERYSRAEYRLGDGPFRYHPQYPRA